MKKEGLDLVSILVIILIIILIIWFLTMVFQEDKMRQWQKLFYWLLALFIIYLIIELIRKLIGGSLGFEELVIGLLISNL